MAKNQDQKKEQHSINKYAKYSGLAIQMGVTIYLGNLLGGWLDEKLESTESIYSKLVTVFAVILSTFVVIREAIKDSK